MPAITWRKWWCSAKSFLRFQEQGAVCLIARVLQVRDALRRGGRPEGDEGAQHLRVGARNRDVELGGPCRHARHLRVHRRVGEDKAPPAQEHSVEAFYQSAVEGDLGGKNANVLDAEINRAVLTSAHRVSRICKLDLENEVQLRRQHLAAPQKPHKGRGHEHFLEMRLGQGLGKAADVVDLEALVGLVDPPLPRLQQHVQVHRSGVVVDVVRALAVGKKLDSLDQASRVPHDGVKVVGGVVVDKAESHLDALGVDKVRARRQGHAHHPRGRGCDGAEGAWEILNVLARYHV